MRINEQQINEQQMRDWLGSDADFSQLVELLVEVANGKYYAEQLLSDVLDYAKEQQHG